ncbi:MAG TPA: bifunctional glutamate N-acetyltransferase/amino-acid acetyltransferase ArgJ [Nocardioidaceae bacterium]|nr:bifunctional glutamate N-acetyltransferase/amino-acid acetyltransferase ArgJ [Nocardioidaceae bacterium]
MSVTAPAGFRAAGISAGLADSGRLDLAVVVNDGPRAAAAGVFTTNRVQAHPVLWSRQAIADGAARAVVTSSAGANCATGPAGFAITHATAEVAAEVLGIGAADVQVCSTGLIGVLDDRDRLLAGAREALATASVDGGAAAADAIRTTDSVPKQVTVRGDGFVVGGMAKGAGMLAPGLATMLVFLTTDADVDAASCDAALRDASAVTFDRLDSDGCQSTNDTVLLLASGASGTVPIPADFEAAVHAACADLARQLIADAEGSEHDIAVRVVNAVTENDAVEVARSVARSNLFKAAVFGGDPNWGRVLASVGTTGASFDPLDLDVALNGTYVCRSSAPGDDPTGVDLSGRAVEVLIDLKAGRAEATVWTNDLTHSYVHENSAYST